MKYANEDVLRLWLENPKKPYLIAEIGCNHKGSMDIAKNMISILASMNIPCVKFQKRSPRECLSYEQYHAPHPNPANSYGDTYGEHREFLEFNQKQHKELKKCCKDNGIDYSCSVWDLTSAKEIIELNPKLIKIPSACNEDFELAEFICKNFNGDIHVSTGMTTKDKIHDIFNFYCFQQNRADDFVVYHCTSGYPVDFPETYILGVDWLNKRFKHNYNFKGLGFSGHHKGIAIDVASYALGAEYIERHFTLDRTWKGTDHAASLEPTGIKKLWRDLNATYESLKYKDIEISECEVDNMKKLKFKEVI